jgi:hypothetical protein
METLAHVLALLLAVGILFALLDGVMNAIHPDQHPTPLPLPAGPGWRPETAWRSPERDASYPMINSLRWQWNANPHPIGTDQEWQIPCPEWLHPFYGLRTL